MFPMQNFEPESAMISAASNSALIEKYLRNTCLGQGAVPRYAVNFQRDKFINVQFTPIQSKEGYVALCFIFFAGDAFLFLLETTNKPAKIEKVATSSSISFVWLLKKNSLIKTLSLSTRNPK